MTEQVPDSGQGLPDGAAGLPTPQFSSDGPMGQQGSGTAFDEDAFAEKLLGKLKLEERIESALMRTKDTRLQVLQDLGGVQVLRDYIKAKGGDVDAGIREYQIDQLLSQKQQSVQSPAPGNAAKVDPAEVQKRASELLVDAGIAFDDADYLALTKKPYRTPDEFYQSVSKFAIRRAKQQHTPGAATLAVEGGAAPVSGSANKTEKLLARQSELSRKSHLTAAEKAELAQVKSSLRAEIGA